jgi:uncharacterized zinc-type alcohol dehydrogenase-like protein
MTNETFTENTTTGETTINEAGKFTVKSYGASGALIGGKTLRPLDVERNKPVNDEVLIEILYCGVCHSDIHQVANDWKNTIYPCVPGHEIVGKITEAGTAVTKYKVGDIVGVGCMIDSCKECKPCMDGEEQYCQGPVSCTMTYNGYFKPDDSEFNTFGGYSTHIVCKESFVLRIPENLEISAVAPILCAGVTTYSPLKHWNIKAGDKVGIVGIGGLGHMAVMIARAMGATVTAITTQRDKRDAAMALGADEVLVSEDMDDMQAQEVSFDFILCTIPEAFDVNPYICLLNVRGSLVTVGLLGPYKDATDNMEVAKMGRCVGGSLIGGIAETQEVLDFCSRHNILPVVEMINIQDINEAFDKVKNEDVRFRYVIDMSSLK